MYVNFIFVAIFLGYSIGSAPIVGYHYGAGNQDELRGLLRKSVRLIAIMSMVLTAGRAAAGASAVHDLCVLRCGTAGR